METLTLALMVLFGGCLLIASLWLLVVAFQESILWGLACLFVPLASLFFVITHWEQAKRPFALNAIGFAGFVVVMLLRGPSFGGRVQGTARAGATASAFVAIDQCPNGALGTANDGFANWCCAPSGWRKIAEGKDCSSTLSPSSECGPANQGAMSLEACSTLGNRKNRR
jgi:hypothetical protein